MSNSVGVMNDMESNIYDNTYFAGFTERDDPPSPGHPFQATDVDYWYGKKRFDEIVARELFEAPGQEQLESDIDSRFQKRIREFPYVEVLHGLQAANLKVFSVNRLSADVDGYKMLVGLLGTNTRLGTIEDHKLLSTILQKYMNGRANTGSPSPNLRRASPIPAAPLSNHRPLATGNDLGMNISYYTSMLKEKADVMGLPLKYSIERAPSDPESYMADLDFHKRNFIGYGRSKQLAKHQASLNACRYLESQRESML